jgi:magnesium transporter
MAITKVRPGLATRALLRPLTRAPINGRGPRGVRGARALARPAKHESAVIDWAAYVDGRRIDTASPADSVRLVREKGSGFSWVGLHEPEAGQLEALAEVFGLHPLAVEDAVHAHQRPKLERFDDVLFFVLKTVGYVDRAAGPDVVVTGEVMVFCGPDFVVTVRHGEHCSLRDVRGRLEERPELLALGPAAVLHAISDRVVDGYLEVAQAVQLDIDEVEVSVFSAVRTNEVERIYRLKREVIELKRAVGPLAGPLRSLVSRRFVPAEIREYFRDVEDHLTRVTEQVESCDELLTPILQAHLTQVTVADNQDMRKISAWVAIMAVPTAVAGIYGMNFDYMPELHTRYGYPLVLGFIAVTCLLLYRGFRRNRWL